jgi:hypothetical protein
VPSAHEVEGLLLEVESLRNKIAKFSCDLTVEERRRATRFRPGGETIVSLLTDIARAEGVMLPKLTPDDVVADLRLIERIRPLVDAAEALSQTLSDTLVEAQSECWWGATAFYTALARAASLDARLETALRPAVDFFAIGSKKGRNGATQTPPGPTPAAPAGP